jgi:hypothetical protein
MVAACFTPTDPVCTLSFFFKKKCRDLTLTRFFLGTG